MRYPEIGLTTVLLAILPVFGRIEPSSWYFQAMPSSAEQVALIGVSILAAHFLIAIPGAIWAYKDSKRRGDNGPIWVLFILSTSVIGIISYLVLRRMDPPLFRDFSKMLTGTYLRTKVEDDGTIICNTCGVRNHQQTRYCNGCGAQL